MLRIAHRGASAYTEENSLAALKLALTFPIDAVEIDVRKTKDGHLIISHDAALGREARCDYIINRTNFSKIKTCKLKNGENILTLEKALNFLHSKTMVILDIKEHEIEKAVVKEIKKRKMQDSVIIDCFYPEVIYEFKRIAPKIRTMFDSCRPHKNFIRLVDDSRSEFCACNKNYITRKLVIEAHKRKIQIIPWVVNTTSDYISVKRKGVDGVFTDYPRLFRKIYS